MTKRSLLLGVEAIGQGAIDGGISGVYAYPGTPSTEITEYIQGSEQAVGRKIHRDWSANEKTAMEAALGMSYAGKRALVCMKHVGLNVAADAFVNSSITGVNGGLVVVVADDPSMHSSQNEQDSRFYAKFSMIPVLEPTNQQEAYEMARGGFELSEKYQTPVMLRITTRLAHSRAGVKRMSEIVENTVQLPSDQKQFILLPAIARKRYQMLLDKQIDLETASEESTFNQLYSTDNRSLGIIASGITFNYLMELFPNGCPFPVLKISQYPLPIKHLIKLYDTVDELLVLEEGYPLIEEQLQSVFKTGKPILGRLSSDLPRTGELNPDFVAEALQIPISKGDDVPAFVSNRPPALCQGCGHQDMYKALNQVMEQYGQGRVFSDIGCYTLGALPPYRSIFTCVDMGASITMAKGAADAGLDHCVAVIGDSTFTHSGMTGLLDAVNEGTHLTVIVSDNESVSMTGGQDSSAFGKIETICEGIGINPDRIRTVKAIPKNYNAMVAILEEELAHPGVSVVVPRRECIQRASRRKRAPKKAETLTTV